MTLRDNLNVLEKTKKTTKSFLFRQEKESQKVDKDGNESVVTVFYKITFVDSAGFIATSLSNLVGNLAEGIFNTTCKDCNFFLNMNVSGKI